MKKLLSILAVLVLAVLVIPVSVSADTPLTLVLENKTTDWVVISDGITGTLLYHNSGPTFDFSFTATGLEPSIDYSLIYYANPYPGNNPGGLIATGVSTAEGSLSLVGSPNTGSIPSVPDSNMVTNHSGPPDNYSTPFGGKIWLVPSSCYNSASKSITVWSPTRFLFETNLINYTDTDAPGVLGTGGTTFTSTVKELPASIGLTVSPPTIAFGDVYIGTCSTGSVITLHNSGNVPIKVTATTSSGFYTSCLKLSDGTTSVNGWVSTTIPAGTDYFLTVKICPTIAFSGSQSGSVSFMASYAP